jgi:hypothetical protein
VSSAFDIVRPSSIRVIGLVVSLGLLALLSNVPAGAHLQLPLGITIETDSPVGLRSGSADTAFAASALILGPMLSWLFAERAARGGWRTALAAALGLDLAAVVLGAFVVAGLATFESGADAAVVVERTLAFGLIGLVLLGIPMLALVFVVAIVWVSIVRVVTRTLVPNKIPVA